MQKSLGFTLIELLVVVLIIGILAAGAVPQYQKAVEKARLTDIIELVSAYKKAAEVYYLANGSYPTDPFALDIDVFSSCIKVAGHSVDFYCPKARIDANFSLAGRIFLQYCPPGGTGLQGPCSAADVKMTMLIPLHYAANQSCSCSGDKVLCEQAKQALCP